VLKIFVILANIQLVIDTTRASRNQKKLLLTEWNSHGIFSVSRSISVSQIFLLFLHTFHLLETKRLCFIKLLWLSRTSPDIATNIYGDRKIANPKKYFQITLQSRRSKILRKRLCRS